MADNNTMGSQSKPAQADVIRDLIGRVNLLLKNGMVTKDFVINIDEAAAITGYSIHTLRRYANARHVPCYAYPGKYFFPLKELCEWVQQHYKKVTVVSTSEMNGYQSVKMGRPKKRKGLKSIHKTAVKSEKDTTFSGDENLG